VYQSVGEFVKRTLMVFVFWFFVGGVLAVVYSELATRVYTTRDTPDAEEIDDDELQLRRLEPHHMFAFALALASAVVVGRVALEFVASQSGRETAAIISGQAIIVKPAAVVQEEQLADMPETSSMVEAPQQPPQVMTMQPQQPSSVQMQQQPPAQPQQLMQAQQAPPPPQVFSRGPY